MNITVDTLLTVVALVAFGLATFNVGGKVNLVALGLFALTLTLLV